MWHVYHNAVSSGECPCVSCLVTTFVLFRNGLGDMPVGVATSSVSRCPYRYGVESRYSAARWSWYIRLWFAVILQNLQVRNSQFFPADAPCDMLSNGRAAWSRHSWWATLDSGLVYGNTPCGRGSTELPRASTLAKNENSDGCSILVEMCCGSERSMFIVRSEGLCQWKKNSNDTIWHRTSDLPICSTALWPLCHRGCHVRTYELRWF